MASGTFYKSISAYDYRLVVEWISTAATGSNSSVIRVTAKLYCPYELYISGRSGNAVTINGAGYSYDSSAISTSGGTFTLGTVTSGAVAHNADGSKSVAISCSFKLNATINGTYYGTVTASDTVELDSIPRAAQLTAAPNFTDEDNPAITYANPSGNAVTSLQACISLTGANPDIAYRDVPKTGTSYTFALTTAERELLRNATTTANSRRVYFYLKTVLNGETYYSKAAKTLEIINALPTMSPTVSDNGTVSKTLTGDTSRVIRGYNSMHYAFNAAALKGAEITGYMITCGDKVGKLASGSLGTVYGNVFTLSVTDSRGNTTQQTIEKTLVDYVQLTCNLAAAAPNAAGALSFSVEGSYYNGSFGAVTNALTVQYRVKEGSGSYGAWTSLGATVSGNTYTAAGSLSGLDYRQSYTLQARAMDMIYNADTEPAIESAEYTGRTVPVFDWGKDDFNLNAPLGMNGSGIVLRHTEAGNTVLSGTNTLYLRPNGTEDESGQLRIDSSGNATISGGLSVAGRQHGAKTLWSSSGGYYMNASQSVNLSQAVSAQPHGIVLVFSVYASGAQDYGWQSFFVSKEEIAAYPGKAHVFIMATPTFTKIATKNIFIDDTTLTGHDNNGATGTAASGITYSNNSFVLRRVVGV